MTDPRTATIERQPSINHRLLVNALGGLVDGVTGVAIWLTEHTGIRWAHTRHAYAMFCATEVLMHGEAIARTPLPCPLCHLTPFVEPYGCGPGYQLLCHGCYDGTEDAGSAAHLNAVCDTVEATVEQWNEGVEMETDPGSESMPDPDGVAPSRNSGHFDWTTREGVARANVAHLDEEPTR